MSRSLFNLTLVALMLVFAGCADGLVGSADVDADVYLTLHERGDLSGVDLALGDRSATPVKDDCRRVGLHDGEPGSDPPPPPPPGGSGGGYQSVYEARDLAHVGSGRLQVQEGDCRGVTLHDDEPGGDPPPPPPGNSGGGYQ